MQESEDGGSTGGVVQVDPGPGQAALEVTELSVSYGKFVAVGSATFSVHPGECVAVIGPNGHGKSSMVTAIAGLVRHGGEVRAFGRPLPHNPKATVLAGVVLVPERRHLYPSLSTRDNILLGSYSRTRRISARKAWQDVADVIDMFPELNRLLDQKAGTLSGGQQQMVALARAMAAKPRILLLDEPCLGLAEAVSHRVYDWLREMTRTDMTILLVEENPVHALAVADRALRIYKGVLAEEDKSAEIAGAQPA